jgi:hypothetical protein
MLISIFIHSIDVVSPPFDCRSLQSFTYKHDKVHLTTSPEVAPVPAGGVAGGGSGRIHTNADLLLCVFWIR